MSEAIAKSLTSWVIADRSGHRRIVDKRPTRWDASTGEKPLIHEVQWDESVYLMVATIMSPEEIDGPMVKVNDEAPEQWEKAPQLVSPITMPRWIAQEIFRRIQRIVPRSSYGPGRGMKSSCTGSSVNLEIPGIGAFRIKVEED
jgi:hypothetical protein